MIVRPHTLSIITTHQCTAACDHCCFSCSPHRHNAIPVPHIHRYIEQAPEIDSFKMVVFTGGECFLLGKHLDECVGTATRNGFQSRFVSNGYWATSPAIARKRLQRLIDQGLTEANFSTGDMHSVYVPVERIKYGAIAAADMGLTTVVMVELFKSSRFDFDALVEDPQIRRHVEAGRLSLRLSPWMPFEGESELHYTHEYLDEIARHQVGCTTVLRVLAINPDEHLIACCGLTFEEIEEVHIGDLKIHTIAEILRQTPDDFIKIWIHLHGPEAVISYAQQVDPSIKRPSNLAHICDTCRFMYHHPKIRKVIQQNPPANMHDIIQQYYQSLLVSASPSDDALATRIYMNACSIDQMKQLRKVAVA